MTKIPLKLKKWLKYYQNPKNDQNTPPNLKNYQNTPKTKKLAKYLWNPKNDQNTSETQKMTKIPLKP